MNEFELIEHVFCGLTPQNQCVSLGIGDDAALLRLPEGQELAISTDCLVVGRHFPATTSAFDVGWKSLAVNLSDLAAMGARPIAFTLSLTLETADPAWLKTFAEGLGCLATRHGLTLVGGDTTRGPMNISLTVFGVVPTGAGITRKGAQVGDLICVTGTLGDAALALQKLQSGSHVDPLLLDRLNRPTPRIGEGLRLQGVANAGIDLSDGLAGDLAHVLRASGVGARVNLDRLPVSEAFSASAARDRYRLQATCGDDYELCVCLPPAAYASVASDLEVPLSIVGEITREPGLVFEDNAGQLVDLAVHGFQHF